MQGFLAKIIGSVVTIVIGGLITPAVISSIKKLVIARRYKRSMLKLCLEELRSNLHNDADDVSEVANTTFGRTSYIARQIVDLAILDVSSDKRLLMLLLAIIKKEDDLKRRAETLFGLMGDMYVQIAATYRTPSLWDDFRSAVAQSAKKEVQQQKMVDDYRKDITDQIRLAYSQLRILYEKAIDELEAKCKVRQTSE